MAIKVNGTTVINDSRVLTNIASVDATTATAIGNAGIGGTTTIGFVPRFFTASTDIIGESGKNRGALADLYLITSSMTTSISVTAEYLIIVIGAGGQGENNYTNSANQGGGGGGGGVVFWRGVLTSGTSLSITVGAGAAFGYGGGRRDGAHGGNSSVTGGGLNLQAGGGRGGGTVTNDVGGLGGTATGGTINLAGGNGLNKYAASGFDTNYSSDGGAAGNVGAIELGPNNSEIKLGGGGDTGTSIYGADGNGAGSGSSGTSETNGGGRVNSSGPGRVHILRCF